MGEKLTTQERVKLFLFTIRSLPFFCSPHHRNKILKKASLKLSSFLGFDFDGIGRPIQFQIHSRKGTGTTVQ